MTTTRIQYSVEMRLFNDKWVPAFYTYSRCAAEAVKSLNNLKRMLPQDDYRIIKITTTTTETRTEVDIYGDEISLDVSQPMG